MVGRVGQSISLGKGGDYAKERGVVCSSGRCRRGSFGYGGRCVLPLGAQDKVGDAEFGVIRCKEILVRGPEGGGSVMMWADKEGAMIEVKKITGE